MNYQTFLDLLNAEKLTEKIRNRLGESYDVKIETKKIQIINFFLRSRSASNHTLNQLTTDMTIQYLYISTNAMNLKMLKY